MSDREKLLGIGVVGLLVVFGLFMGFNMVKGTFDRQDTRLQSVTNQINLARTQNNINKKARDRFYQYKKRALPMAQHAQVDYGIWLSKQLEESGLKVDSQLPQPSRSADDAYAQMSFRVNGEGTLDQLVSFLDKFYRTDHLHRVSKLLVTPQEGKTVKIGVTIDALQMTDLDPKLVKQLSPEREWSEEELTELTARFDVGQQAEDRLPLPVDAYNAAITQRNLFAPGNKPPKFEKLAKDPETEAGERISISIKATDPDDGDKLKFELLEGAPEWAKISDSGRFSGRPQEVGSYDIMVKVTDDAVSAKSDEMKFTVVVKERTKAAVVQEEPKAKGFDKSKLAYGLRICERSRFATKSVA